MQFKHEDLTGESGTIVFYDCDDIDTTQQEVGKYATKKLYFDSILNVKLQVECENSTGNLNDIQRDFSIVNEVIYDRTDDANSPPLPIESNMPCIHSIIIDPSMIPNDGERVVLL